MRDVFLLRLVVEIFHRFAAELLVLAEVEVAAGGDAFEFLHAEGELEHHVHAGAGVVGEFLLLVIVLTLSLRFRQADGLVPFQAFLDPVLVPVGVGAGLDEELQFHLLELAAAEGEIARVDLVAERFADLGDAERDLLARDAEDVVELREDALRGFGPQIGDAGVVLDAGRRTS